MKRNSFIGLNMTSRPLRLRPLKMVVSFLFLWMSIVPIVNGRPQDAGIFEHVASQSIALTGHMVEMVGKGAMIGKNMDFQMPFAKAKSETKAGTGAALRTDDYDYSSEEDRRKRSLDVQIQENTLIGEEFLLPLPLQLELQHLHRDKRAPCHYGGSTGGGGGGTGGGDIATGDDEIDLERRRRAYAARRRKAAAKRKKTSNDSRKKKLIDDDEANNEVLTRRRRQTEVDDLNQTMQSEISEFAKHAQQMAEKISNAFNSFVAAVNEMGQKLKQHFSDQNPNNDMEI